MRLIVIFTTLLLSALPHVVFAQENLSVWLTELKQEALAAGISNSTVTATINHIELLPNIIKLDLAQPEFISPFLDYYQKRVDTQKIVRGRQLLAQHESLLSQIEVQYGVPKSLLVAFWGMETNYGSYQGNIDTLSALATLAYDGRRAEFFRNQLFDSMRMLDSGHTKLGELRGSWAGAFGNMQFMPTTFMMYAVDGDGDNQIDIVNSSADAFASAANYLSQVGWRKDEPAMIEVQLPPNFNWQHAQYNLRKPIEEWAKLGVKAVQVSTDMPSNQLFQEHTIIKKANTVNKNLKHKKLKVQKTAYKTAGNATQKKYLLNAANLPNTHAQAAIVLPQGWSGPAFMIFDNFDAVMDWNRSINYALSVTQLAKRLNGEARILGGQFAEVDALSFAQMYELQVMLNARNYNAGEPDGFPGLNTQAAIRSYQQSQSLPADGYASPSIYHHLKRTISELKTTL